MTNATCLSENTVAITFYRALSHFYDATRFDLFAESQYTSLSARTLRYNFEPNTARLGIARL